MRDNLLDKLKDYNNSDFYPFHMPGHKRNIEGKQLPEFYRYDITEIDGFDNLHQPEGIILEAQEKAASLYHSEETYFLVNGSTSGILSAVSAVSEQGGKLLIARNCHKAVYHGAFLNRMEICYIYPELISEYDMAGAILPEDLKKEIQHILSEKDVKIAGVVITSPTYDGVSSDIREIAKVVHSYGIPLIVDQAHGAHFGFHPDYPKSAVAEGADIVIHSVHKTLPAPTQTAIIHKNGNLVDSEKLRRYLRIYQSSSPSYPLMVGMETALDLLEEEGYERLERLSGWNQSVKEAAENFKYIRICPLTEPGKIIISVKGSGITGQQLYDIFREKYHLQMEMASGSYVTAILTMMDKEEGIVRLIKALEEVDAVLSNRPQISDEESEEQRICSSELSFQNLLPKKAMELWQAYTCSYEEADLRTLWDSISRQNPLVAAEFVNLYPPGIPLLVPGEIIDENILPVIEQYLKNGYNVQGIENNKIKAVKLPEEGENYEKN